MVLTDLIKKIANLLGFNDVETLESDFNENPNYALLKNCVGLTISNIATNYKQFVSTEDFDVSNNGILISAFTKKFLKVKKISSAGQPIFYRVFADKIEVPNANLKVEYAYIPTLSSDNEVINFAGIPNEAIIFGAMAEYAFISGMNNEGKVWRAQFESLMFGNDFRDKVLPKWSV
ncbi:MAG: hypothetical protein LBM01_00960 [Christensenellaceae bacterium]|jgi:hypothetical protein|nr:hypothetical protein [Christensenellaceae bacterium]